MFIFLNKQNSLANERHGLQELILDVLKKEVFTPFNVKKDLNTVSFCVNVLCTSLGWKSSVSTKQSFCWALVGVLCSTFNPKENFLECLKENDATLIPLCSLFQTAFCLKDKECSHEDFTSPTAMHCKHIVR